MPGPRAEAGVEIFWHRPDSFESQVFGQKMGQEALEFFNRKGQVGLHTDQLTMGMYACIGA